ncbi:hypothetical protein AAG570_009773 [Ranatra chinensis]|uniref:Uncharacterized protein n=1 Tax=Ranatra chinensis TaxID=642074 RepID=A0ABD0YQ19_9HEMI
MFYENKKQEIESPPTFAGGGRMPVGMYLGQPAALLPPRDRPTLSAVVLRRRFQIDSTLPGSGLRMNALSPGAPFKQALTVLAAKIRHFALLSEEYQKKDSEFESGM